MAKTTRLKMVLKWEELKNSFNFESEDGIVKKANCKVCSKHFATLQGSAKYKRKVLNDAVAYGRDGTTCVHKSNFTRHVKGEAHKVCLRIETGEPLD